jgi:hypothetical protein
MKKNELIHFHALLATVARDYLERGIAEPADFAAYEGSGVTPMTLRASRERHEEAVRTLARILAERSTGTNVPTEPIASSQ